MNLIAALLQNDRSLLQGTYGLRQTSFFLFNSCFLVWPIVSLCAILTLSLTRKKPLRWHTLSLIEMPIFRLAF